MRLCLVSDNLVGYHDTWSGAEMVVQYLASLLEKESNEVVFLTIKSKKKETPKNILSVPSLAAPVWFFKKIFPVHIPIRTMAVFFQLLKAKPDVIHIFHSNSLFIPVMVSAKILKIPATFTVLDYFIICPKSTLRLSNGDMCCQKAGWNCRRCLSFPRVLERFLINKLSEDLKQIVTFTETSKTRLIERGLPQEKIQIRYIYSPSLPEERREGAVSRTILFVGSFHPHKGLEIAIRAFSAIGDRFPEARLLVVGRGNNADVLRIQTLVNQLNLRDKIQFLGQRENAEVLQILARSEIVLVPEQWFSDFGPVILVEALALGRAVVASRIGSIPEFIEDGRTGLLADYNRPEKFAEKILWLLEHPEEARAMGEKGGEKIENFLKSCGGREIVELYTIKNF